MSSIYPHAAECHITSALYWSGLFKSAELQRTLCRGHWQALVKLVNCQPALIASISASLPQPRFRSPPTPLIAVRGCSAQALLKLRNRISFQAEAVTQSAGMVGRFVRLWQFQLLLHSPLCRSRVKVISSKFSACIKLRHWDILISPSSVVPAAHKTMAAVSVFMQQSIAQCFKVSPSELTLNPGCASVSRLERNATKLVKLSSRNDVISAVILHQSRLSIKYRIRLRNNQKVLPDWVSPHFWQFRNLPNVPVSVASNLRVTIAVFIAFARGVFLRKVATILTSRTSACAMVKPVSLHLAIRVG